MENLDPTAAPADGAVAPHASDDVPVETVSAPALVIAKEAPAVDAAAPAANVDPAPGGDAKKPEKLPKWAEDRMAETSFEAREARREAKRLADELAELRAAKTEPAAPATPTAADAAAANASAPVNGFASKEEFDKAVAAEANKRDSEQRRAESEARFNSKSNEVYSKGKAEFGDNFDTAAQNLRAVGAMNPELLEMAFATEDPHKVLYELGSDPDRAATIVSLSPAARAIEIAKLSISAPKKPAPISNAPRPVPSVDGSARISAEPLDTDDDETFFRKREAQLDARA